MPIKNVITPLRAFLRSCSGKSQSEILKLFLFTLIEQNTVSESGNSEMSAAFVFWCSDPWRCRPILRVFSTKSSR